jgi:predicted DsbA family dithiol-disulfide isomerase
MSEMETGGSITVYSDYVCPFCYLGRESLRRYQADREQALRIDWHPFDLRAGQRTSEGDIDTGIDDGKDEAYFERAKENVRRLQAKYDVEMDLEIATDVDSFDAQLLSYHVKTDDDYDYEEWLALDEALLAAIWREGRDIGDETVLRDVADTAGLDPNVVEEALADDALEAELYDQFDRARREGVTGVPTFAYGGYAARGAVPPEQIRRLVDGA